MRRLAASLAVVLACVALAACGEKQEDVGDSVQVPSLDLMLDWFPNPDHVAIYQAIESGYFRDVSLDVRPRVPSDPAAPDQAGRGRPRRPRDLLRARGAPRARAGPSGGGGRRAGADGR